MQLKNGFHLITNSTNFLASIPNHNNNQPFSNVNLVVNELNDSPNDPITVYSLYENGLNDEENGVDETPEGTDNLNFTPNEFGFLELISSESEEDDEDEEEDEEEKQIDDGPTQQIKQEHVSCITCGCFGLHQEFHDASHCTYDCALITRITRLKEKKKLEEEEEMRKQNEDCKRNFAPFQLFGAESTANPFEVNDLLEAIDPEHQCFFCPVRVVETLGHRLLLKFIGYPDKYNFWVYSNSHDIFPVHWTTNYYKANQLHFHSPPNFSWESYIQQNPTHRVAPASNFPHVHGILSQQSPVKIGMKLEAVDIRNKNLICVATVSCVMGDRFLIHFDSWDSLYDYWTTLESAWVHPVGYCKYHGIEITPPHCYETPSEFDWDEYLKKTASVPVPKELFRPQPPLPFQVGQELEVIDKRSPRLLRPATIHSTSQHTLELSFPHLNSPSYNFEINDRSPDLHAVGYSTRTSHPLDSLVPQPETPCPNHQVCRSACSIRGPEFSQHSKSRDCPYSTGNLNETTVFTDRVVIFEDKYYDLGSVNDDKEQEHLNPPAAKKVCLEKTKLLSPRNMMLPTPINFNSQVHSPLCIPKRSEIVGWSHDKISKLVLSLCSNLPTAQLVADQFKNNLIDGESFLMLTQSDMTDALGIKLGPAIKIYNMIRLIDLNK